MYSSAKVARALARPGVTVSPVCTYRAVKLMLSAAAALLAVMCFSTGRLLETFIFTSLPADGAGDDGLTL